MKPLLRIPVVLMIVSLAAPIAARAQTRTPKAETSVAWRDVKTLTVEGQAWTGADLKAPFDRLPAKAEGVARPPVWNLSRDSAGIAVRFVTDSPDIHARWTLNKGDRLAMPHMAATGVSGLDLYARDSDGKWRWVACGQPTEKTNTKALAKGLEPGEREYMLYLPLYNGVSSVEIGVPAISTGGSPASSGRGLSKYQESPSGLPPSSTCLIRVSSRKSCGPSCGAKCQRPAARASASSKAPLRSPMA